MFVSIVAVSVATERVAGVSTGVVPVSVSVTPLRASATVLLEFVAGTPATLNSASSACDGSV